MIEASAHEVQAMSARREPIVDALIRDAIPLAGQPIADVLAGRT